MSSVLYELHPGLYDVDARASESCPGLDSVYLKRYQVDAKDEKVIGIVVRTNANRELDVAELTGFEDPRKLSGGNSKIR